MSSEATRKYCSIMGFRNFCCNQELPRLCRMGIPPKYDIVSVHNHRIVPVSRSDPIVLTVVDEDENVPLLKPDLAREDKTKALKHNILEMRFEVKNHGTWYGFHLERFTLWHFFPRPKCAAKARATKAKPPLPIYTAPTPSSSPEEMQSNSEYKNSELDGNSSGVQKAICDSIEDWQGMEEEEFTNDIFSWSDLRFFNSLSF